MSDSNFDTDIAVVGMAGRFSGARNIVEFWNNLRGGVESLTRFTEAELLAAGADPADLADPNYVPVGAVLPDMECFDAKFFGFSPREASIMDPQHRHFLEVSWQALENAGHMPEHFAGSIGVFGGSGHNAYMPYNLLSNPALMRQVGFFLVRHTGNDKDFLTTRVSYLLNLKGPSVNVQTACSTSLVAIHLGVQSLLNRECDMALAGGVTIEMPHRHGYVYRESEILSPDGHCHAFDADSKGTVFGSGAGVVVLRRLQDAIDDGDFIHAVIKGSAVNNDGSSKVGYMAPSVDGQAQAIAEALAIADVSADTITYVEAHGTGTPVGDPIEVAALTQAFRQSTDKKQFCGIGSVKSNIGHTDTAAGVANFMKVALALQHGELPPSLFFEKNNPACEFESSPFYVNSTLKKWTPPAGVPRRAGVSSLGVGGTNAHIVVQEAPVRAPSGPSRRQQLIVQSAKSTVSLDAGSQALAAHFEREPGVNLADAAYTLRAGRRAMKHRRVVVASSAQEAAMLLTAKDTSRVFTDTAIDDARSVAFMFAGGGAQHPNMGLDLYREEPVFRAAVDEGLAICERKLNRPLRDVMFPAAGKVDEAARKLEQPSLALPALLTIQVAQARLLMSWGVKPAALIGHSMGEYTAAHLAGVFTFEEALTLVELRGRLFESLPEGAMLSVPLPEADVAALMTPELSVSVINAPKMTVVGGPVAAIEALQAKLAQQEVDAARVRINVAAHSSMLEPILEPFGAQLRRMTMKAPTLAFVSNLSGTWITAAEATDPAYWVRHLRNTVRFADGMRTLLEDESRVLVEVGPGRTLSSLARQHPARKPQQAIVNSMRHVDEAIDDQAHALTALGRLWAVGVDVPWDPLHGQEKRLRVQLPGYQFERARHWVEPGQGARQLAAHERSLHKRKDFAQWFYRPAWTVQPLVSNAIGVPAPDATPRRTLVFVDRHGLGDALAARLRERGGEVVVVREGKGYARDAATSFSIDPGARADMLELVATLSLEGFAPSQIVHAFAVTGDDAALPVQALRRKGFDSLLHLAQAIGEEDWEQPISLLVASDHMQRVAGERDLQPGKSLLLGPASVIPREFTNVRCTSMDVELPRKGSRAHALLLDALAAELEAGGCDAAVAWRGAQRWVQQQVPMPLTAPATPAARPARLRERGTYLITGGLGGVGLALARHLATTLKARLVLVGRSAMPPREQWAGVLANPATPADMARRLRSLLALEQHGAEVMVASADVTDAAKLEVVLAQARARFGDLHGVLHTAGVLDDGVIQLKDEAVASRVLAPKVEGTLALEAALTKVQTAPLDFVVLFSSISAFAGLAGQVDYAAANAFLDAYAQDRVLRDGTWTVAVNWSQWQEVGMAADLAHQLGLDVETAHEPVVTVGHALIDRCLLDTPQERIYETRFSRATHWLLDEHRVRDGEALIPGTGYLEIVRTAFAHRSPAGTGDAVELSDVTFLSPFVVHEGQARDLRVHLRARGSDGYAFVVSGRAADAAAGEPWSEHVRGVVARINVAPAAAVKPADVRARCQARHQSGAQPPVHLHFGPRWNNIVGIDFGAREALVELALPQPFVGDLESFPLHPSVLDLATGGAQTLVPGYDESRDFFVPASYERVRVFAPLPARVFSHVRLHDDEANGQDLAVYDVTIVDADGRVLVEIDGFTMIRVRDKALLAGGVETHAASAVKPRATANNILSVGLREGILTKEGADVLERVLAWGAGPQVIVSPQDLEALLVQLRGPTVTPTAQADAGDQTATPGARMPTTSTEKLIAQMWSEMLGHARVAAGDNFFDLGGHSLLAVQVINKLKKRTGKALPLTALLEAPTVEELAALVAPDEAAQLQAQAANGSAADAPDGARVATPATIGVAKPGVVGRTIIPIKKGEGRPPLFLVHDGLGETLLYRTLAYKLDPAHAVYGLQPAMRADGSFVHTRIADMAAAHVEQLRSVQPEGPYLIAGLCAGGVIAQEMATQLEAQGQHTSYLGILDAADVEADPSDYESRQRMARLLGALGNDDQPLPVRLIKAVPILLRKAINYVRYRLQERAEARRTAQGIDAMRAGQAATIGESMQDAFLRMYEQAHREHRPEGARLVPEGVVVYRAMQGRGGDDDVPFKERYTEPDLGWSRRFVHAPTVRDVPGGHTSLLQDPNVQTLAELMQRDVDAALARQAAARTANDRGASGGAATTPAKDPQLEMTP